MLIPKNRHEYYLAVISGNDYPTFPPKIREEMYLAKLAGREVDVPTPKTPKERAYYNIINDIKFEPENRWQTFVAAANDDSITAPVPRTREEIWWANISLSREVIVEYVGTLPATLQTVEGYLESYKIYGNTVQDGTPTPENPIVPSGCGVRTANLFDESNFSLMQVTATVYRYGTSLGVLSQGTYTFNTTKSAGAQSIYLTAKLNGVYSQTTISSVPFSFTADGVSEYIIRTANNTGTTWEAEKYSNMMLNSGSTALPYEPYGYKLPLTVNGVEYPIYLEEVETTRRIKKLVLTGEETNIKKNGPDTSDYLYYMVVDPGAYNSICTHLPYKISIPTGRTVGICARPTSRVVYFGFGSDIMDAQPSGNTAAGLKEYLAAQYAAGTPVTVWYVLAEPETGIVNEPLMKIGDYSDTIDSTQTSVQILTSAGTTVIDYDGEPKPDKVELTYKTIKRNYISADDKVYQDPNGQLLGG